MGYLILQPAQALDGAPGQVGFSINHLGGLFVGARHLDHSGDLKHWLDVGAFQHPLAKARLRRRCRCQVGDVAIEIVAGLGERAEVGEGVHADLTGALGALAQGAIRRDSDEPFLRIDGDLAAAVVEHSQPALGHQTTRGVRGEAPVAREARTLRPLNLEEPLPLDGHVQRAARWVQRPLAKIAGHPIGSDKFHRFRPPQRHRWRGRVGLLDHRFNLEPGGIQVGDVVGDDVHLTTQNHLAGETDVERIVHERRDLRRASFCL